MRLEPFTIIVVPYAPSIKPLAINCIHYNLCSDGSIDRYKARPIVLDNKQEFGLDYVETFAPVAKMTTARTILATAASESWPLHHLDVKNAFLHGDSWRKFTLNFLQVCLHHHLLMFAN